MLDIILIGSGPSSLFTLLYLNTYFPNLKLGIICQNLNKFHCTYGIFLSQIEKSWIFNLINKNHFFSKIFEMEFRFNNKKIDLPDKYGLMNNDFVFDFIINKIKNVKIILGTCNDIQNFENHKIVYYYQEGIQNSILTKFVIEGIGYCKPIGLEYTFPNTFYKQVFVGYKIKIEHTQEKVILMDWKPKNYEIKSFCYTVPLDKDKLLVEETILVCKELLPKYYDILEERLKDRLKIYEYEILEIEKNTIILNSSIPKFNSKSFGIGQVGNMMNVMSGYSVGYNIYHIPEICNLIIRNNFDTKQAYLNYWDFKKRNIFKINYAGIEMLDNLNQLETGEFLFYYFKEIVLKSFYQHKIIFLNCSNEFELGKFFESCIYYFNLPKKYLGMIVYYSMKRFLLF